MSAPKTKQKMTKEELLSVIAAHRRDSLGVEDGELSNDRARALDRYHGRPYGDEKTGRSAVVSRDLAEAVDWALPAIMRVFTASGNIGEFEPVGPEDEEAAKQETEYINQVVMRDNNGFMALHDAIKDAMILRNGYLKHYWDVKEKITESEYSGLTMDEISNLVASLEQKGAEVEVRGATPQQVVINGMPLEVFDIRICSKLKKGKVVIEAVPAEEVRVSKRCRGSLQDSPFTEHVTCKTRSELIEMGMSQTFVNSLPSYENSDQHEDQTLARNTIDDETDWLGGTITDRSMDLIEYCEAYIRVDWDGDGIAELRKVVTVGNKIPDGEEWNEPIDACALTSLIVKRVPHRHIGESINDELEDLQKIKTVLLRQMLDNIYLTNNNQWIVNERVNLKDFMQSLPGGVKRVKGDMPVGDSVSVVPSTPIVGQILPVVDYLDSIKEGRTGISRASTGLDPDTLKQATKGAFLENLNRASQKMEMMTRIAAETGVKELMIQVHALLIKHQDKPRVVQMRGKWTEVNPQEWSERTDMIPKVGLGTGNEEEKRQKLLLISQLQDKLINLGLVGPEQAYALFSEIAETMGLTIPEKFAMAPGSPEFQQKMSQPPPPPPEVQVAQMKIQAETEKTKMQMAVEQQKSQADLQQEQVRSTNDVQIEREKIAAQMELERFKAQLKAETDIMIARLQHEMQVVQHREQIHHEAHQNLMKGGEDEQRED